MKYIDNRINANIVKLEDENNNYMSEDVEGALEEIDSKIKIIEANGYDDTKIKQNINDIKTELGSATLNTTNQTIKDAINEVNTRINTVEANAYDDTKIKQDIVNIKTEIGTEELTTTDQTIKGAVNEIDSKIEDTNSDIETIRNNKYRTTLNKNQLAVNIQNPMSLETLRSKFSKLKDIGVNTIVLCPQANLLNKNSNELLPYEKFTFENVETYTRECLDNGFDVIYKLHVECTDGTWRALINPSDRNLFFRNYENFIIKYAELAQKYNLKLFCVGEEMISISTNEFENYWRNIFDALKEVYFGKTTYGANLIVWDDEHRRNCIYDLVDYIGIDLWAKQCEVDGDRLSSYINLNGWLIPTFEELYAKYGKKIIFTELGYLPTPEGSSSPNRTLEQSWDRLNYSYHEQYYDMMFANFIGQEWLESIWYWCETEASYYDPNGALDRFSVVFDENVKTQKIFKKYTEV